MSNSCRVVVVGAGIVGATVAWHLARRGASVTVLDAGDLGGTATAASWAWINACTADIADYARLRIEAMAEWRRLQYAMPQLQVQWSDGLVWDAPAAELEARAKRFESWGLPVRMVDSVTCRAIEPALLQAPEIALHLPGQGSVDAPQATIALLDAALACGARVMARTRVRAITTRDVRVTGVHTADGALAADVVVIAAGTGSPALLASLDIALPEARDDGSFIAVTEPIEPILEGLLVSPDIGLRQDIHGRLIATLDASDTPVGVTPEQAGLQAIRRLVRLRSAPLGVRHASAARPMPSDGHPVVGPTRLAGLHVVYTHSGLTLAPLLGRFVSEAILDDLDHRLLFPFRPARFATQ